MTLNKKYSTKLSAINPVLLACLLVSSGTVWADARQISKDRPKLNLQAGLAATDNLNPTLEDEVSAVGTQIQANGHLTTSGEGYAVSFEYAGRHEAYEPDDNVDTFVDRQTFIEMSGRALFRMYVSENVHIDAEAGYQTKDDKFGEGLSRFRQQVVEHDSQKQKDASAKIVYGSDVSRRFVALKISQHEQTYDDNNTYAPLSNLSQKKAELDIAFRQSASQVVVNLSATDDDYDALSRADNKIYQALIGGEWQFSGKSTFKALVGKYWNDVVGQGSSSGVSWLVNYDYSPREDMAISFNSSRRSQASQLEAFSTSIVESYMLNMGYRYSEQWHFALFSEYLKSEFESDLINQNWEETRLGLETRLTLNDIHQVLFTFGFQDITSSEENLGYSQNHVRLNWLYTY